MSQVSERLAEPTIHITSDVDEGATIGPGTEIWRFCHIAATAQIGANCMIGQGCYVAGIIGDNCRIQNGAQIFEGVKLEDGVFIGPGVVFTNDKYPKAGHRPEAFENTLVRRGVSIGANATILCGVVIDEDAVIGAGSVVTRGVPAGAMVYGNPARLTWGNEYDG